MYTRQIFKGQGKSCGRDKATGKFQRQGKAEAKAVNLGMGQGKGVK